MTTEKDRSSLKAAGNKALNKPIKHILNASKVNVITSGECLRIDAPNQVYVCVYPPDHTLSESVAVCPSITCESPMETTYYSAICINFPDACFHCGQIDQKHPLNNLYIGELNSLSAIIITWAMTRNAKLINGF